MKALFGTDGIRGEAGQFPLDPATVTAIGFSLASHLAASGVAPKIITGRDTRESGAAIEEALIDGASRAGAECLSAGVITTPGVAFVTRKEDASAGVVISASHNPYHDNGIKIFAPSGRKMDDSVERLIEADVYRKIEIPAALNTQSHSSAEEHRKTSAPAPAGLEGAQPGDGLPPEVVDVGVVLDRERDRAPGLREHDPPPTPDAQEGQRPRRAVPDTLHHAATDRRDAVSAAEAERIGLYNRVVPAEELSNATHDFAARLARGPAFALGKTKEMLNRELDMNLQTALESEAQAQAICMQHPDYREAYEAFVAKREAKFK